MDPQSHSPIPPPGCVRAAFCEHRQFISQPDNSKTEAPDFLRTGELNGGEYEYEDPKFPRIQVRERNNAPSTPASVHETQINSCSSKPAVSMQMELAISGLERSNIFNTHHPAGSVKVIP